MADNSKQRITVIAVSSIILVAMVVALTIGSLSKNPEDNNRVDVSASTKAIKTICDSTDYKDVCIKSLNSTAGNSTDPKELIEAAFQVTIKHLKDAANESILLQKLQQDPRTKLALENCQELADRAVADLEKSFGMFQSFDFNNLKDLLNDLKIWISGALTYQETCLDGFEDTSGDAGEKMREVLKTGMQLTSNGLAMITDVSSVITSLDILPSFHNRRLLSGNSLGQGDDLDFPDWLDSKSRMLLDVAPNATTPDLIVAKDGSGKYTTINDALKDIPTNSNKTFILYIKEGVYTEKVQFYRNLTHLMLIGDGPTKTRITGSLNFIDGVPTYHTATVVVLGEYFIAKDIGFENSAGAEKHQAVALRVGADKSIFYNCQMDGYQDTLYAHTYRQFYRDCVISGTIDFIFGDSAAIFQNCKLVVRKPLNNQQCIVTAQGRKDVRQPTGLVLQNCSFVADPAYYPLRHKIKSYLGRPWKEFSRTIIMESYIDDLIQPEGWMAWNGTFALNTLFYTEFNNRGPGSIKSKRVQWPGVKELQASRVQRYTAARFIEAETWIPASGVPFNSSFMFPLPKENASVTYSPVAPEEVKDLGLPKEENPASDFINGSQNKAPTTLPTPATADLSDINTTSPPPPLPLEGGFSPSPAPYINAASPPIQGRVSPSPATYMNAVSPSLQGGVSPSPAPYTNTASPPLAPTPYIDATPPMPYINAVSPTPQGGVSPSPAPYINTASPPQEGRVSPAPTPDINSASPPPQESGFSPAPTPDINSASPPQEGTTPPAPTPYINSASPPQEGTTPPAPTPYINSASPPTQGTTPPAPAPYINSASPPTQGTTPPAPAPYINSASPPTQGTTPPAPAPYVNSASPPSPPPQANNNIAPSPSSTTENSQATPPAPAAEANTSSPPQSSPALSGASVNSPTSLPASSPPSLSPSSQ